MTPEFIEKLKLKGINPTAFRGWVINKYPGAFGPMELETEFWEYELLDYLKEPQPIDFVGEEYRNRCNHENLMMGSGSFYVYCLDCNQHWIARYTQTFNKGAVEPYRQLKKVGDLWT